MKKTFGILALLILVFLATAYMAESFLTPFNLENLIRRTSLFGIISIGVAFVIITGGIDLSIGSVICLIGCGLPFLLQVDYQPRQQATLTEINAAQSTVTLSAPANFSRGDQFHLSDSTAKNTGVYKIKSARGNTLTLEPAPREDDQRGRIVQVFPIAQRKAKAKSITAEGGLAARDQVTFVNANGDVGLTAKIQSTQGHEYSLSEAAPDDAQYFIALHRHPRTSVPVALALVLLVSLGIGLSHGFLVAKIKLQPFVVTLCGLLLYRGLTRGFTEDQTQGFQAEYPDLRLIATAKFGQIDYALALGLLGDHDGVAALGRRLTTTSSVESKTRAARALSVINDERTIEVLVAATEARQKDLALAEIVRAIGVVAERGDKPVLSDYIRHLNYLLPITILNEAATRL